MSKNSFCGSQGISHFQVGDRSGFLPLVFPASVTNLMQSIGIALTNRALLGFGDDKVAAMGIVMEN